MCIWVIGYLFTLGLTLDPNEKREAWLSLGAILLWPLMLGTYFRNKGR